MTTPDLPAVRLTGAIRPVLAVLAASTQWLSARDTARAARIGDSAARRALAALYDARIVAAQTRPGFDRRPSAMVYRLTPDGRRTAASLLSRSPGRAG